PRQGLCACWAARPRGGDMRLGGLLLPLRLRGLGVDDLADVVAREPRRLDDLDLLDLAVVGVGSDLTDGVEQHGSTLIGPLLGAVVRVGDAFQLGAVHGHSMPHAYAYGKALVIDDIVCRLRRQTDSAYNAFIN